MRGGEYRSGQKVQPTRRIHTLDRFLVLDAENEAGWQPTLVLRVVVAEDESL